MVGTIALVPGDPCVPIRLGHAQLVATLCAEPHTPLERAVRTTLASLGCL